MDSLKNDIGVSFLQTFPDSKWPKPSRAKYRKATNRNVFQPIIEKWGRAFNIPISYKGFFIILYNILKLMVSKSKLPKVSTISGPLKYTILSFNFIALIFTSWPNRINMVFL